MYYIGDSMIVKNGWNAGKRFSVSLSISMPWLLKSVLFCLKMKT